MIYKSSQGRLALAMSLILALSSMGHANAGKPIPIYTFGPAPDGVVPYGGLTRDAQGNLYGVTAFGGANGYGTVYRLMHTGKGPNGWTEEILHSFNSADGAYPKSTVLLDATGNIYGITGAGGLANKGTVYRLNQGASGWTLTTLHTFGVGSNDGYFPGAGLTMGPGNLLYGTVASGLGAAAKGIVFSLSPQGDTVSYTILHDFLGGPGDGAAPTTKLLLTEDERLIGATAGGGVSDYGVVFLLTQTSPGVWSEEILHSFQRSASDLAGPSLDGALIRGSNGSFYGCGYFGRYNLGGVYQLLAPAAKGAAWSETVIDYFGSQPADPNYFSFCGLSLSASGSLLGTTDMGGLNQAAGSGAVFSLTPPSPPQTVWTENVLYDFVGGPRGHWPSGSPLRVGQVYYGVTQNSGFQAKGPGVVYEIIP